MKERERGGGVGDRELEGFYNRTGVCAHNGCVTESGENFTTGPVCVHTVHKFKLCVLINNLLVWMVTQGR